MNDNDNPWSRYSKAVKPLRRRRSSAAPVVPVVTKPVKSPQSIPMPLALVLKAKTAPPPSSPPSPPITLERRTERRLRQGEVVPEASLDLHGMTQEKAYAALNAFLVSSLRGRKKLVLVITGKGQCGDSILRANLPRWCAEPNLAAHILTLRPAAPRHGGTGAWYIMLRRT